MRVELWVRKGRFVDQKANSSNSNWSKEYQVRGAGLSEFNSYYF